MRRIIVSLLDWADFNDLSRTTAQVHRRAGLPILREGPGGKLEIDLKVAQKWLRERREAEWEERLAAVQGNPEAMAARTRKLQAEARMAEANAAEREGELVPAGQVAERWGRMAGEVRERVLVLPAVAVQKGIVEPGQEAALAELAHAALRDLAGRNGHA